MLLAPLCSAEEGIELPAFLPDLVVVGNQAVTSSYPSRWWEQSCGCRGLPRRGVEEARAAGQGRTGGHQVKKQAE